MTHEFDYVVCKLSGLVREKPINALPFGGFNTLDLAKDYCKFIKKDNLNFTYVFHGIKPVFMLNRDGDAVTF
jgi:hypothetical protein